MFQWPLIILILTIKQNIFSNKIDNHIILVTCSCHSIVQFQKLIVIGYWSHNGCIIKSTKYFYNFYSRQTFRFLENTDSHKSIKVRKNFTLIMNSYLDLS